MPVPSLVDVVVSKENSIIAQFGITNIIGQLAILSLLTLLIWTLESLSEFIYDRLWRNLAQTIQHELRLDAYSHLQELAQIVEVNYPTLIALSAGFQLQWEQPRSSWTFYAQNPLDLHSLDWQ